MFPLLYTGCSHGIHTKCTDCSFRTTTASSTPQTKSPWQKPYLRNGNGSFRDLQISTSASVRLKRLMISQQISKGSQIEIPYFVAWQVWQNSFQVSFHLCTLISGLPTKAPISFSTAPLAAGMATSHLQLATENPLLSESLLNQHIYTYMQFICIYLSTYDRPMISTSTAESLHG